MATTINLSFDSSVSSAPAGFETTMEAAAAVLEGDLSAPVTINIDVGYGEINGTSLGGAIAEGDPNYISTISYGETAAALTNAGADPGSMDPTTAGSFDMPTAIAKATGLLSGTDSSVDGYVGVSTTAADGSYDLEDIDIQELTHAMGRTTGNVDPINYPTSQGVDDPLDLFDFASSGHLVSPLTPGGYYSSDDGVTEGSTFASSPGSDYSDWSTGNDAFSSTFYSDESYPLSAGDITEMESLGFGSSTAASDAIFLSASTGYGASADEWIVGNDAGGDSIYGASNDTIIAGAGNTTIGGASGDQIFAGQGTDFIDGSAGSMQITGGDGGSDSIWSGTYDTIYGGGHANDTIGGVADDTIYGGAGTEFIDVDTGSQLVYGGSGAETVWGGTYDTVQGGTGDLLVGGVPYDTLIGGSGGNETLSGWVGDQLVVGGSGGNETLTGGPSDTVFGGSGDNEFIDGSGAAQLIYGGSGGNDTIWTHSGDTVYGYGSANEAIGGVAGVTFYGGPGSEVYDGSQGSQTIFEGSGSESITGGSYDTVFGGTGTAQITMDSTVSSLWLEPTTSGQVDSVTGFTDGSDYIHLPSGVSESTVIADATTSGGNTTITIGSSQITLIGVSHIDSSFFA